MNKERLTGHVPWNERGVKRSDYNSATERSTPERAQHHDSKVQSLTNTYNDQSIN